MWLGFRHSTHSPGVVLPYEDTSLLDMPDAPGGNIEVRNPATFFLKAIL
jgi:hypothetical protein